jgi:type IV pilus assembly protein PilB
MHRRIGELLVEMDLIGEEEVQEALEMQRRKGGLLGEILVDLGYITDKDVLFALGAQSGMEVVDLEDIEISGEVLQMVPVNFIETFQVIPVSYEDEVLTLAMADPLNVNILDDLKFLLNCEIQGAISNPEAVGEAIEKYYAGQTGESLEDLVAGMEMDMDGLELVEGRKGYSIEDLEKSANAPPVVKLLNMVLLQAIRDKASDIHLEPFEEEFKIRYRVDGVLYELMGPPQHLSLAMASRVKVMSGLDIAETRLPQDGRIELTIGGRPVDLRVSTLPTMFGESVVMRILDRSAVSLDLDQLGLRSKEIEVIRSLVEKPNGIILVTGPTGCGKTTTLYACLTEVNRPELKVITTEDPVEYDLPGIVQVQINEEVGLTYASCLRSILRQDPDKILVGEIRDLETAQIAVESSLTGHVVFSTLHTNDAPTVVTRLVDLGLEPYLLAATLEAVVAQRLVRKICEDCKEEYEPTEEELYELELTPDMVRGKRFFYGRGCKRCNNTGYKGRTGIFEIMMCSEMVRQMITDGATTADIRRRSLSEGMRSLRESGLLTIYDGITSIEEVVRETVLSA